MEELPKVHGNYQGNRCQKCLRFYNKHDAKCHWCGEWKEEEDSQSD